MVTRVLEPKVNYFMLNVLFDLEPDWRPICVMSQTIGFCHRDKIDSNTACLFWRPLKLMYVVFPTQAGPITAVRLD